MKRLCSVTIALMVLLMAVNVSAVTVWIGDEDGFGWAPVKVPELKGVDKKAVDRKIENKKIQLIEVIPDINQNGKIGYRQGDNWDNRSATEKADISIVIIDEKKGTAKEISGSGVKFTDVTLSGSFLESKKQGTAPGLAKDVVFTFDFTHLLPFKKNDPGYGEDHIFSLVYADYDVTPLLVNIDGTDYPMEAFVFEWSTVDGVVGSLVVTVPWEDMEDGKVVVKLIAPQAEPPNTEPYTAFDYALLDVGPLDQGPYPLCANEEIPLGTHYIVDTGAAKSVLDKATLEKGVQLTVLSPRSANCKPKTTGKGEPGHYLHCSDTYIANRNYFVFPESMAEEISAKLAEKETTDGDGLVFTILSREAEDCPLPQKGDKPKKDKK